MSVQNELNAIIVQKIVAERDRLKANNAELVDALRAMYDHFGIIDKDSSFWHPKAFEASKKARAALAKL